MDAIELTESLKQRWDRATPEEKEARLFVVDCLHSEGSRRNLVNRLNFGHAYLKCDGLGNLRLSPTHPLNLKFDWHHVRDSSPEAILKAAAYLKESGIS